MAARKNQWYFRAAVAMRIFNEGMAPKILDVRVAVYVSWHLRDSRLIPTDRRRDP